MNTIQHTKFVNVLPPAAIIDNASGTTKVVDTIGYDYCTFVVLLGAMDIAMTALKVQESDATTDANTLSSGSDITGTRIGTDTDYNGDASALPSATGDNGIVIIEVSCKGRKRYLDLVATFGDGAAGTYCSALAILSKGESAPVTPTERGVATIMRV